MASSSTPLHTIDDARDKVSAERRQQSDNNINNDDDNDRNRLFAFTFTTHRTPQARHRRRRRRNAALDNGGGGGSSGSSDDAKSTRITLKIPGPTLPRIEDYDRLLQLVDQTDKIAFLRYIVWLEKKIKN